jgi:hypothetical protein
MSAAIATEAAGESPVWPEFAGPPANLGPVSLRPVSGGTPASRAWNAMPRAHHPRGDGPLCGARIRYLIVSERHGVLGGLSVSAEAWRLDRRSRQTRADRDPARPAAIQSHAS